jgi:serine/threonine protein kinase
MEEFENYIVEKKIGEGAQGVVYLAKHKTIKRSVAIKSLHPELVLNTNHKERFIEEARTLGSLNHSSIVTLYEYIANNNGYHLIMEYLNGEPLDSYIKNISGPIQEIRAIDIFIQILEGIEYIHQNNIVHRDIKPSNIIIDSKDKIKLLDFGIAKNNQDNPNLTIVGNGVGGTPMYMSPEHVSNQPITIKSDIYSLGVTLWQMLTGVAPYEGMTIGKIYTKIEAASLKDIQSVYEHVSLKMNEIVKKATKKNPNDRFDSCGSFIIALKELKEHLSSQSNETLIKKKYIEINVKGITDAFIKINSKEITGSGIIYAAMPGEEVIITIQKEGYKKYTNSLIFSDNIRLDVTLVDEKAPVLSIFRGATQFIELGFHKVLLAIKTAKFGKENKDLISSQKEKIETLKNEHNSTIVEIKKAKMDIIILFMFILIAALIIPLVYNYFNNEPNRSQTPVINRTVNPPLDPPVEVHKVQINPPSETPPISPTKKINKTEIGSSPKLNNNPNPTVMSIDYRATKIEEESPDSYTEIFEGNYYALIIGTKNQIIQVYRNNKQIARFSLNGKVSSLCYYKGILYTNKNEKSTVRKHYIDFKNNYVHTSDITSVFNKQETKDKYSAPSNSSVIKIIKN